MAREGENDSSVPGLRLLTATTAATKRTVGDSAIPAYGESSMPIPVATAVPTDAPTQPRAMSEATPPQSACMYAVYSLTKVYTSNDC